MGRMSATTNEGDQLVLARAYFSLMTISHAKLPDGLTLTPIIPIRPP